MPINFEPIKFSNHFAFWSEFISKNGDVDCAEEGENEGARDACAVPGLGQLGQNNAVEEAQRGRHRRGGAHIW